MIDRSIFLFFSTINKVNIIHNKQKNTKASISIPYIFMSSFVTFLGASITKKRHPAPLPDTAFIFFKAFLLHILLLHLMIHHMPLRQLFRHILYTDACVCHQNHRMIAKICQLVNCLCLVLLRCCDDNLRTLLADFFEDLVQTFIKQIRRVASFLRIRLTSQNQVVKSLIGKRRDLLIL